MNTYTSQHKTCLLTVIWITFFRKTESSKTIFSPENFLFTGGRVTLIATDNITIIICFHLMATRHRRPPPAGYHKDPMYCHGGSFRYSAFEHYVSAFFFLLFHSIFPFCHFHFICSTSLGQAFVRVRSVVITFGHFVLFVPWKTHSWRPFRWKNMFVFFNCIISSEAGRWSEKRIFRS